LFDGDADSGPCTENGDPGWASLPVQHDAEHAQHGHPRDRLAQENCAGHVTTSHVRPRRRFSAGLSAPLFGIARERSDAGVPRSLGCRVSTNSALGSYFPGATGAPRPERSSVGRRSEPHRTIAITSSSVSSNPANESGPFRVIELIRCTRPIRPVRTKLTQTASETRHWTRRFRRVREPRASRPVR
jgi:hypothetical protein